MFYGLRCRSTASQSRIPSVETVHYRRGFERSQRRTTAHFSTQIRRTRHLGVRRLAAAFPSRSLLRRSLRSATRLRRVSAATSWFAWPQRGSLTGATPRKYSCPKSSWQKGTGRRLFRTACTDSVPWFSCFRRSSMLISNGNQKMKQHSQSRNSSEGPTPLPAARLELPAVHGSRATGRESQLSNLRSRISIHSSLPRFNRYPIIRYPSNLLAAKEKTFSNRYYFGLSGACSAPRHSPKRLRERQRGGGSQSRPYISRRADVLASSSAARSAPTVAADVALVLRRGFFLGFGCCFGFCSPRRDYDVHAGVGDGLAEVFVRVGDEKVDHVAVVGVGAELGQRLIEIGVGHGFDGGVGAGEGFVECVNDLGFVGGGLFESFGIEAGRKRHAHIVRNIVIRVGDVQEYFADGADAFGGRPAVFIGGDGGGQVHEFLVHAVEVQQGLRLHVVAGRSRVLRLRGGSGLRGRAGQRKSAGCAGAKQQGRGHCRHQDFLHRSFSFEKRMLRVFSCVPRSSTLSEIGKADGAVSGVEMVAPDYGLRPWPIANFMESAMTISFTNFPVGCCGA